MIKAVIFDLDDTLYLERDYVKSGFKAVDGFLQQQDITGFFSAAWAYFEEGGRGDTFNEVLSQLNISYDKAYILELIAIYRQHKPVISLLPDAYGVIAKFSEYFHLGLITDGYSVVQNNKVDALQLKNLLHKVVITDELGSAGEYWKPHARPYEVMQAYFSVPHNTCIYIGDNVKKDFVTANKLGWKTVQICRKKGEYTEQVLPGEYRADHRILSMNELPELISRF